MLARIGKLYTKNRPLKFSGSLAVLLGKSKLVKVVFLRVRQTFNLHFRLVISPSSTCQPAEIKITGGGGGGGTEVNLVRPSNIGLFWGFVALKKCNSTLITMSYNSTLFLNLSANQSIILSHAKN